MARNNKPVGYVPTLNCVCCGDTLTSNEDYCSNCNTSASVSREVASGDEHDFISVLGASNTGKTVFLGLLLDMLSNGPEEFCGQAASAFSVNLQEEVITALENRRFPDKTPSEVDAWQWMYCKVSAKQKKSTESINLISPDLAGEAIATELSQPGFYPVIQNVVSKSSGILILCDSMRVRDGGASEDLFGLKLASYVAQHHGLSGDDKNKNPGPAIAVVFTKCDICPEAIDDPAEFAANNTPRLFEFCRRTFKTHRYFASSVVGGCGTLVGQGGSSMGIPFHVQPRGVIEPLQWMVQ